ncbi:hypothetical protein SLE2022_018870 [Rubroshorea leprosula]
MGVFSKPMLRIILLVILSFLFIPASSHLESGEDGYISALISNEGLDFAKDLLINKSVSSMIPLQVPDIDKYVKIPVIGRVHVALSNITIYSVDISSSFVRTGESGVVLVVSVATANLSMNWSYSYRTWLVPVPISDQGSAFVEVQGMEVGVDVALNYQEGTLTLSLLDCGCNVEDVSIKLDGGASWLYQVVVDAFQRKIVTSVENAVSKKIREGMIKLDSLLQSLPRQIRVNSIAALNVTFTSSPVLSDSSVELEINGLITGADEILVSRHYHKGSHHSVSCKGSMKMFEFSLDETVFESASLLYFNANYMHWTVDEVPEQSLLNTAGWRYIVPQLYEQYPDENMDFNISVTSLPIIQIGGHDINTTIYTDFIIDVLHSDEVVPVACISLVINASGSAEISGSNLAGSIRLVDFTASLKWSNIGPLHLHLIQSVMSTILETAFLPYLNLHLGRGLPVPLPGGYALQNAEIVYVDSRVVICSDVTNAEQTDLKQLPTQLYQLVVYS